jgi:hypothetical protein
MTAVVLTGNFFGNARGITLVDSASLIWAFDKNLNLLSGGVTGSPPSGVTATITTAKLTGGGSNGSMTFTNGVLTASTPAT